MDVWSQARLVAIATGKTVVILSDKDGTPIVKVPPTQGNGRKDDKSASSLEG